jgi:YVTN family beta-propeller protein
VTPATAAEQRAVWLLAVGQTLGYACFGPVPMTASSYDLYWIVVTPDDRHLLVGIMGEDYVEVIDWRARRSVGRIRTGTGAHNFRGVGDGRNVWVSNRVANTVSRIDMRTLQVVQTIPVAGGPDCMEITDDGRLMWVTQRFARQVAVIDLEAGRVIRTIAVGRSPHGVYLRNRAALL